MAAGSSAHTEDAFETVIESHLLTNGYNPVDATYFGRDRAIFARGGTNMVLLRLRRDSGARRSPTKPSPDPYNET